IGRAIFDRNVATFDVASLLQALPNGAEHSIIELSAGKQADQGHAWLLCVRRERPCHRHAAEQRDERAPFHFPTHSITSSALTSSVAGTSRPRALAVFILITNWYLVGACTGRSPGFSPLRMRST